MLLPDIQNILHKLGHGNINILMSMKLNYQETMFIAEITSLFIALCNIERCNLHTRKAKTTC